MNKLGILIPTVTDRAHLLARVVTQLDEQRVGHNCILIINEDQRQATTGAKRNALLDEAKRQGCSHIAGVDDDDVLGPNYVRLQMEAVNGDYDCASLWGQYFENNRMMNPFHHSIKYDRWFQDKHFYYRNPNHLNCIKLELLEGIRFRDQTIGEDGWFSKDLHDAGVLKRQYEINEIIYYYFAGASNVRRFDDEPAMAKARGTKLK
jgi:hypothetical protein